MRYTRLVLLAVLFPVLVQCQSVKPRPEAVGVAPRELAPGERDELVKSITSRFNQDVSPEARYSAAGPFRFVSSDRFLYMERTDVGSVAYEQSRYGVSDAPLDPRAITKEVLLSRIEAGFARTSLRADGREFDAFFDEFVGAAEPKGLSIDFDPRSVSKLVARTAAFRRSLEGIPVFGSELIVGLTPDGAIGRFRLHWPKIDDEVLKEAKELQNATRTKRWIVPEVMRSGDIDILEETAGVGHSAMADPGFRQRAVVRVLYRKSSRDPQYPLASTTYKYFDSRGREVVFNAFPKGPATPADQKPTPVKP